MRKALELQEQRKNEMTTQDDEGSAPDEKRFKENTPPPPGTETPDEQDIEENSSPKANEDLSSPSQENAEFSEERKDEND